MSYLHVLVSAQCIAFNFLSLHMHTSSPSPWSSSMKYLYFAMIIIIFFSYVLHLPFAVYISAQLIQCWIQFTLVLRFSVACNCVFLYKQKHTSNEQSAHTSVSSFHFFLHFLRFVPFTSQKCTLTRLGTFCTHTHTHTLSDAHGTRFNTHTHPFAKIFLDRYGLLNSAQIVSTTTTHPSLSIKRYDFYKLFFSALV